MRFREFKPLTEGNKSDTIRYNSEVGMLAAFVGADISKFDPKNPGASIPAESLANSQNTYNDIIKYLEPNYDPNIFSRFYNIGLKYKEKINQQLVTLEAPPIGLIEWSGGSNVNEQGVADIIFKDHPAVQGVSIKAERGITLRNLTAQSVNLSTEKDQKAEQSLTPQSVNLSTEEDQVEHPDVFARFAQDEWTALKKYAMENTLEIAMATPGKPYAPKKPKYQIVYHPATNQQPSSTTSLSVSQPEMSPGVINQQTKLATSKIPMGQNTQQVSDYFEIFFKGQSVKLTKDQILNSVNKNALWQRVFGDHVQAQWNRNSELRELGDKLFSSISEIFVAKIKAALTEKEKLHKILAMGKLGYFYATPNELYFVPGTTELNNLVLKDVEYGSPTGTAQKFIAKIGVVGGEVDAEVLVYVRYANGMFEENPTVRIQNLKNPTSLTWAKLI